MSIDDGGDAKLVGDIAQEFIDDNRRLGVKARVGLVTKQIARVQGDGTGNGAAFLHTAREFAGILVLTAREVHTVDAELCPIAHLTAAHRAKHHQREHHVAHHSLAVEQGRALEQHTYFLAQLLALLAVHLGDVTVIVEDFALVGVKQPHDVLNQHRLARAGLADDEVGLAVIEFATHVEQHLAHAIIFLE